MTRKSFYTYLKPLVILAAALTIFAWSAEAALLKVSRDEIQTDPPTPAHTSSVEFDNDATRAYATATLRIRGVGGFNKSATIPADSMYLECPEGGTVIRLTHDDIPILEDGSGNTYFNYATIREFNQDDVGSLAPPITAQEYWCMLYLSDGDTWRYPFAIRLDKMRPMIDAGKLRTYPIIPIADGSMKWSWNWNDPGCPGDWDGASGCADPNTRCNRSDTRREIQVFRRKLPALYDPGGGTAETTGGDKTFLIDTIPNTNQDRFKPSPDEYCYVWRVLDTAENYSVTTAYLNTDLPTLASEKCIVPDDLNPVFEKVEYFKDYDPVAGFSGEFPVDDLGVPQLTSNACLFSPSDCTVLTPRRIQVKITVSEPLFDGQSWYGANVIASDGFDNDHDGNTDEEQGGFNYVDDDLDGFIDGDVATTTTTYPILGNDDFTDNDADGYVDEIPRNPAGVDGTTTMCTPGYFYNYHQQACVDKPRIRISSSDVKSDIPSTNNLDSSLKWVCTQDGITTHPDCQGLNYGETIYRVENENDPAGLPGWDVSGSAVPPYGVDEGEFSVTLSGSDGVGNLTEDAAPAEGANGYIDNTSPVIDIDYFSNDTFSQPCNIGDHDNDSGTPNMPITASGTVYLQLLTDERLGATPTMYIFLPTDEPLKYQGIPQPTVYATPSVFYPTCNQSAYCDYCTGATCTAYIPTTAPCKSFKACFNVNPQSMNNGYAAVTVLAMDRLRNQAWNLEDYEAAADPHDANRLSDDTFLPKDSIPTWVLPVYGTAEPDTIINSGQLFAIDTYPPATPAISLPITPCDGIIARENMSCLDSAQTINNPTISWKTLNNGVDDDIDTLTDEECIDGVDDDSDGRTDEDGKICNSTGTQGWEIGQWRLQVSTTENFDAGTLVFNSIIVGTQKQLAALAERPLAAPYYWRIAPYDKAGNVGPYNPYATGTIKPYFTFGIDTEPPRLTVEYYTDSDCTDEMPLNQNGIPTIGDTASDPNKIVCIMVTSNEPVATSSITIFETWQLGAKVDGPITTDETTPPPYTTFTATFEVDANGSGQKYLDGEVQLLFTTTDLYGNTMTKTLPATGSVFIVDASTPEISCSADPQLASLDKDQDGTPGELTDDAVTVSCHLNKFIGNSVRVRVKQNNFNASPVLDDGLDNDCDGKIDEDFSGEDLGSYGQIPGSGCYITLNYTQISTYDYTGLYNVVNTLGTSNDYDGEATIYAGDTNPASPYYLTDFSGNPIYGDATFQVDTKPPGPPTLKQPINNKVLSTRTPQISWSITAPRAADLLKYEIQIATASAFLPVNIAARKEILDDGHSTIFFATIQASDNADGTPLEDNKYYWRMFAYDQALNKSVSSLVYIFYVDIQPPAPPIFDAVTTPTTEPSSLLSGSTSPTEANAQINIYVNSEYKGTVQTGSDGKFTLNCLENCTSANGIDDDSDSAINEDPDNDEHKGVDDDLDNSIDEDPPGIFLAEGENIVEGQITDAGGNQGARGCSAATPFYDPTQQKCIITRDSGAPRFSVLYYSNSELTSLLPIADAATGKQAAPAGTVYMRISATEELEQGGAPNPPTFTVNFQGSADKGVTPTTSINGSKTQFLGSFPVSAESPPAWIDGDATIVVIGVDKQGNQTPAGTLPTHGAYLTIDTRVPTFDVSYWLDETMYRQAKKNLGLLPVTKAGTIYLRIAVNEPLSDSPTISINQPGSADITDSLTTAIDTSGLLFLYPYVANEHNGSDYIDGLAEVTITGHDRVGNTATAAEPNSGSTFEIDTTPPAPPVINEIPTETYYTQIQCSGVVRDAGGNAEPFALAEIFSKMNIGQLDADDGIDNDGDSRIDEEPNGANGIDDDRDAFIDEDYSDHPCGVNQVWSYANSTCQNIPPNRQPTPDGSARTDTYGSFDTTVSGIKSGVNYVYARATDIPGNISGFSAVSPVIGLQSEGIILEHTFPAGWNLVGVPLQPASTSPESALQLYGLDFFQLQDGIYVYGSGLDAAAPGECYWVYFPTEKKASSIGATSNTNTVALTEGWNMISVPYNKAVNWDSDVKVNVEGEISTLGTTTAEYYVHHEIYFYNNATNLYDGPYGVTSGRQVEPWIGFMILAYENCSIVFPSQYEINP